MANTCMGDMVVVLPKEQKENFLSCFYDYKKEQKEYLDLSLDGVDEIETEKRVELFFLFHLIVVGLYLVQLSTFLTTRKKMVSCRLWM